MAAARYDVGVDIGGTFTDLVAIDDAGRRTVVKTPSTPGDPSRGMLAALAQAAARNALEFSDFLGRIARICHGTTVTTNAVIERSGCKLGMLTTRGVRDTIEVRRGMRELEYLYDYTYPQPQPLCPRNFRRPVRERVQADGSVVTPLQAADVQAAVKAFKDAGVEALAVCFLWSFRNPDHERQAAAICREEFPEAYLSLSHQVAPVLGEYLRFQTTVVNAYVGPIIERYMRAMDETLRGAGYRGALLIVTSNGGLMSPDAIMRKAAVTLTSGPASGPVAGLWYGRRYGVDNFITMDMGGTSFDTALVKNGEVSVRSEQTVAGVYHIGLPTVDVHAIGAGGGTIAWLDQAGGLHVGPQSAGADPGPACYMKGGKAPTITDANLVLGRLNPDNFVGGEIRLSRDAAVRAIAAIAEPKGMSVEEMARAIVTIAIVNMADAIEVISVRRGENPRDYCLLVGGGAGPGHAAELARMMGMNRVIVPRESSIFCAAGGIISDIRHDYVASVETATEFADWPVLARTLADLRAAAAATLEAEGVAATERYYKVSADMKYVGQYHEISIDWPDLEDMNYTAEQLPEIVRRFHERHEMLYAHHDETEKTFISNVKLSGFGKVAEVPAQTLPRGGSADRHLKGEREVWFEDAGFGACPVYDGDTLPAGVDLRGPCIIEQRTTTLVVPPAFDVSVSSHGDFLMTIRPGA